MIPYLLYVAYHKYKCFWIKFEHTHSWIIYMLMIEIVKSNMYVVSAIKQFIICLWNSNYLVTTIWWSLGFHCYASITIGHKLHTIMIISHRCMCNAMVTFCACWLLPSNSYILITSISPLSFLPPPLQPCCFYNFHHLYHLLHNFKQI
jgi:hypothetical protein